MSEAFDKVRDVRELPIFPLPLVLFPDAPLPLHIFEERYRALLRDVLLGNRMFGVSYFDAETASLNIPPEGHLGCVAEVRQVETLPDGRSNLLTVGVIRYRLEEYSVTPEPYLIGRVTFFEDDLDDHEEAARLAAEVRELFTRIGASIHTLSNERGALPELPDDLSPEPLSFMVASAMDLDSETKLELLALDNTAARLERLQEFLGGVVNGYEERARIHKVSQTNGHSGKHLDLN